MKTISKILAMVTLFSLINSAAHALTAVEKITLCKNVSRGSSVAFMDCKRSSANISKMNLCGIATSDGFNKLDTGSFRNCINSTADYYTIQACAVATTTVYGTDTLSGREIFTFDSVTFGECIKD